LWQPNDEDYVILGCTIFDTVLEIFLSMRYINLHFTYLLTYLLTVPGCDEQTDRWTDGRPHDG